MAEHNQQDRAFAAYADGLDHLADELRRLDLRLHLQVVTQRAQGAADPFDRFKGLVLSEAEVESLLADSSNTQTSPPPQPKAGSPHALALAELEATMAGRRQATLLAGTDLPLARLARLFDLNPIEEQCLMLCLAPELDRKYGRLYAYLNDDITCRQPTVGLVLQLLCPTLRQQVTARALFTPHARLVRHQLVHYADTEPAAATPLLTRPLVIDQRIAGFLLGHGGLDCRLQPLARLLPPAKLLDQVTVSRQVQSRLRRFVTTSFSGDQQQCLVFHFHGPAGTGRKSLARTLCHDLNIPLLVVDLEQLAATSLPVSEALTVVGRELALLPAALCLENLDALVAAGSGRQCLATIAEAILTYSRLTFILGRNPWSPDGLLESAVFLPVAFALPGDKARKGHWERAALRGPGLAAGIDFGAVAGMFRFTPGQVRQAMVAAGNLSRWRAPQDGRISATDLYAACRSQSNTQLRQLARRIEPNFGWQDLILPVEQLSQLREICSQTRYRHVVFGDWGFDGKLSLGKGLAALFSGPPGTGKTMAAEVLANELQLALYRIDLSQVVSKYIGETEKNLDRIFTEAETANAILFFDEADALFGKRSEVKDAHDRYANMEIGYLLQRMEEYDGLSVMASNLRQHMDEAFTRRFRIIVEFPFPDEAYREMIWRGAFPRALPMGDDVDLDFLARRFRLSGGDIRNIALGAAYYAAEQGRPVVMEHLVRATGRELRKAGKPCTRAEFGDYYGMLAGVPGQASGT